MLPLRTNIIPKNITLDTCGLIQNFITDKSTADLLRNYKKDDNQNKLWNQFFKLDKKIFKKTNYTFNYMIKTDAISISILFVRLNGDKPMKKPLHQNKSEEQIEYIEKIIFTDEPKNKKK